MSVMLLFVYCSCKELRDVHRAKLWLVHQVAGGFAKHLWDIWCVLGSDDAMRMCEFVSDSHDAHRAMPEELVMLDDEHASNLGSMIVGLVAARAKRCLWYFLPPVSMAAMMSPDATVSQQAVARLQQMQHDYEKLSDVERPSRMVKEYLKRHPCQLLAVKQLVIGFEDAGWTRDNTEVDALLHQRFSCLMQSQLVEDINNVENNFKQTTGWGGRYRRPETSMYAAIESQVVSKTHRFDPLVAQPTDSVDEVLPERDFNSDKTSTIPLDNIVSTTAASPYFSTTAEHLGISWADEAVIRNCVVEENYDLPRLCWQGFFGEAEHMVVFKVVVGGVCTLDWHLALHHFPDSAVMAIPVELKRPAGCDNDSIMGVEIRRDSSPVPVVVRDLGHIIALPIVFKSWTWQVQFLPAVVDLWQPAVRAFKFVPEAPVLEVAAKAGWWSIGITTLEKIGNHLGCPVSGGDDIFDSLWSLTQKVLPAATEDDLLRILQHRLKRLKKAAQFSEELLSIDEAVVCLDESDQQEVHRMQGDAKDRQKENKKFKESYKQQASKVRISRARTPAAKARAAKPVFKGPTSMLPVMSQAEAKRRMPPPGELRTYLWRSNHPGAWLGRVDDMPVISRNDQHHGGEQCALRLVLQGVWSDWLPLMGFDLSDCPIEGLFDVVDPRTASSSPGGASGVAASSSFGSVAAS